MAISIADFIFSSYSFLVSSYALFIIVRYGSRLVSSFGILISASNDQPCVSGTIVIFSLSISSGVTYFLFTHNLKLLKCPLKSDQ